MRELKAKDVKELAKILTKVDSESIKKIKKLLDGGQSFEVGFGVVQIIATVTDEIWAWLASLIDKTAEELDEMPFDTPKDLVSELMEKGEIKGFFGLASAMTPSNPDTDGQTQ